MLFLTSGLIVGTNAIVQFLSFSEFLCMRVVIIYSLNVLFLLFFPAANKRLMCEWVSNHFNEKKMNTFLWLFGLHTFLAEFSSPNLMNIYSNLNGFPNGFLKIFRQLEYEILCFWTNLWKLARNKLWKKCEFITTKLSKQAQTI